MVGVVWREGALVNVKKIQNTGFSPKNIVHGVNIIVDVAGVVWTEGALVDVKKIQNNGVSPKRIFHAS